MRECIDMNMIQKRRNDIIWMHVEYELLNGEKNVWVGDMDCYRNGYHECIE